MEPPSSDPVPQTQTHQTPRWVKAFCAGVAVTLVLLVAGMRMLPGEHGPWHHFHVGLPASAAAGASSHTAGSP